MSQPSHRNTSSGPSFQRRSRKRHRPSPLRYLLLLMLIAVSAFLLWTVFQQSLAQHEPGASPSPSADTSPAPSGSEAPSETTPVKETEIPWNLTLVNQDHPLSENYTPETRTLSNGLSYDTRAYDALMDMLNACEAAGLEPLVCSAYRSVEKQTTLFNKKVNGYLADGLTYDEAYAATATEIAIPGTSEHSLGLAADICALDYQILDESQADTEEQQWLMANCAEYGFILRYPKDKESITGIIYEPWHYRYVGIEAAREITEQGLCLEEYLALYYELD